MNYAYKRKQAALAAAATAAKVTSTDMPKPTYLAYSYQCPVVHLEDDEAQVSTSVTTNNHKANPTFTVTTADGNGKRNSLANVGQQRSFDETALRKHNRFSLKASIYKRRRSAAIVRFAEESSVADSVTNDRPSDVGSESPASPLTTCKETTKSTELIKLNIGGHCWHVRQHTLAEPRTYPDQQTPRLTQLANATFTEREKLVDEYLHLTNEYYFERPPAELDVVADFHILGFVQMPHDWCPERFTCALDYWQIPKPEPIITNGLRKSVTDVNLGQDALPLPSSRRSTIRMKFNPSQYEKYKHLRYGKLKLCLWELFEEPQSSIFSKIISIVSMLAIFSSVSGLLMGSMVMFQVPCDDESKLAAAAANNSSTSNSDSNMVCDPEPIDALHWIEYVTIVWFTVEFILRLIACEDRWEFMQQPLNLIDASTIIPFYVEIFLPIIGIKSESLKRVTAAMLVIRILRVLRVARIFKLARYSSGLQTVCKTMRTSGRELSMLMMFMLTGIIFFSTIMYFLEREEVNTPFTSIPSACWWCVVTMTTVGYGDMVPKTTGLWHGFSGMIIICV